MLTMILRETKGTCKDTRKLTTVVRQLETEVSSSSRRLDTVEQQVTSLQQELQQLKFAPHSRRGSTESVLSTISHTPEVVTKKLRTLYLRGFPIETREVLINWVKQQDLPDHEDLYTLGDPSDTVVDRFCTEDDMWTFLRKYSNNRWTTYSGAQIYLGIDNQIRGGDADKNKAIRKLYRASIQINYVSPSSGH